MPAPAASEEPQEIAALPEPATPQPEARPPAEPTEPVAPTPDPAPATAGVPTFPVSVNAQPWAIIEIDGVEIGETPLANVPVAAGRRRFRARMPDGSVMQRTIDVNAETERVVFR